MDPLSQMSIHHSSQFDIFSSDEVHFHTVSTFRKLQLNVRKGCTFFVIVFNILLLLMVLLEQVLKYSFQALICSYLNHVLAEA